MAQTPNVCPQLHMPLQSGSDRVLRAMRRSYRSARFLAILDEVRASIPDAAISTDIIVGFPGETDDDFAATLDVVEKARFASAFTFQYSPRPGYARGHAAGPGAEGRRAGTLRAARRAAGGDLLGAEPDVGGAHGGGAGRDGRGPQGRRDPAPVGPGPRRPARALQPGRAGGAAGRRRDRRRDLRRPAPPRRGRPAARPPAHPRRRRTRGGHPPGRSPDGPGPAGLRHAGAVAGRRGRLWGGGTR